MKYGFVYIWFDRKHKRYYIGSHWGHTNDGYICSSRWMRNAYRRRPHDFKRRILVVVEKGRGNLLAEEHKWLQLISENELGKKYYNLTNHLNGHWSTDEQKITSVKEKLKAADNIKGIRGYWVGRKKSDSHRKKISETLKGRPLNYVRSAETRAMISENNKRLQAEGKIGMRGKQHTAETKAKMSANNAMTNPACRAKVGDANRGKVGLWLNSQKKMAKPGTELYDSLLAMGYKPKEELI